MLLARDVCAYSKRRGALCAVLIKFMAAVRDGTGTPGEEPMNKVYNLSDGRRLMLYRENNRILVLITPLFKGQLPGIRHTDCLGQLFSTAFNGRIYYVYENLVHQIIFGNLDSPDTAVVLSPSASAAAFEGLALYAVEGQLRLFYQAKAADGLWELWMQDPWHVTVKACICRGGGQRADCRWYVHQGEHFLALDRGDGHADVFVWHASEQGYVPWEAHILDARASGTRERELEEALEASGTRERELEEALEASGTRERELEEALEASGTREKELEEALEASGTQVKEAQAREASALAQLASARTQYEALAQTARKLQELGRHWRDKYWENSGKKLKG